MISNYNILIFKIIFLYNIFQINAEIVYIKFDLDNKTYNELTSQFNNLVKYINNGEVYYGKDFTYYIYGNVIYFDKENDKLTVNLYFDDNYIDMYTDKEFTKPFLGKNYVIGEKDYKEITVKELTTAKLKYDENILKDNYIYYIPQKIIQEIKNLKKKPIYRLLKNMYIEYLNKLQREIFKIDEDKNLPLKITYEDGDIHINCIPENFEKLKLKTEETVYTLKFKEKNNEFSKIPNDYIGIEDYEDIINNFIYEYKNYKRLTKEEIKKIFLKSLKNNNNNEILKYIGTKALERYMHVYIKDTKKNFVRVKNDEPLSYQTLYIDIFGIFIKEETYKNIEKFKTDMENIFKELNSNKEENIEKLYEITKKTIKSLNEHNIKRYAGNISNIGISDTLANYYSNTQETGIYETIIRKIFFKIIEIKLKAPVEESIQKLENIISYNITVTEEFDKKQTLPDEELESIQSTIKTHIKKIYEEILKEIEEDKNFFYFTAIPQYYDGNYSYFLTHVENSNHEESKNFKKCIDNFRDNINRKIDEYEEGSKVYLKIIFDDSNSITLKEGIKNRLNELSKHIRGINYKIKNIDEDIKKTLDDFRYYKKYYNYTFVYLDGNNNILDFVYLDENNNILDKDFIIPVTKKNYIVKFRIIKLGKADKVKKNIINNKINNIDNKKNNSINNKTENITEKNNLSQLNEKYKISNKTTYMNKTIDKSKIPNFKNNNIYSNNGSSNKCCCCNSCKKT